MNPQPALFISHGSPMLVMEDSPARRFLSGWSLRHPAPQAILVVSAHWENRGDPAVSTAQLPVTVHDFGGFPPALYEIEYPAPGAPQIAGLAINLLREAGYAVKETASRGLDHGAWAPLSLMFPAADIPVFQVSLITGGSPREHYRYGQALQTLRNRGVLVIGSGSMTHNLYEFMGHDREDEAPDWVTEFELWIDRALVDERYEDSMKLPDAGTFCQTKSSHRRAFAAAVFCLGCWRSRHEGDENTQQPYLWRAVDECLFIYRGFGSIHFVRGQLGENA